MPKTVTENSPMSASEFRRLEELEKSVKDNWRKLGKDLKEIRDSKLYRQTSNGKRQSWEEYCKRNLDLSKQYVDKVIRAAEVLEVLETETKVSILPKTVSQAAKLSGLEPAQMKVACEKACLSAKSEGRKATAKDYEEAIESMNVSEEQGDLPSQPEKPGIRSADFETDVESQCESSSPTTTPPINDHRKLGRNCSIGIHVENDGLAELLQERLRTSGAATTLSEPKGHFVSGFTSKDQVGRYLRAIEKLVREQRRIEIQIIIK